MVANNEKPQRLAVTGAAVGTLPTNAGGLSDPILPRIGELVNKNDERRQELIRQASAAEVRARAAADWHRERAARYLGWCDLPWARQRYDFHLAQAAYQDSLAARHGAIRWALEGVGS